MKKSKRPSFIPRHAEHEPGAEIAMRATDDGGVSVSFSDGSDDLRVSRREFMRISGVAAATAAMAGAGCDAMRNPVERIVPYVDRPEEVRIGNFSTYATVWDNVGVLVKTRVGRPVKLEGNPNHPTSRGGLSARGQASYMNLYDPDRAHTPLKISGDGASQMTFGVMDQEIVNGLKKRGRSASVALLTRSLTGSAQAALVDTITSKLPQARHYTYDALNDEASVLANQASYGRAALPHYRFDRADLIISLQSDFLGSWLSPVEFAKQFSGRRDPSEDMNRLVAFEGMLTLTGARADDRHRVRTSDLVYVAMGLAHQVVVVQKKGPLAQDAGAAQALGPFDAEAVAERTGLKAEVLTEVGAELANHTNRAMAVAGGVASATPSGLELEAAVNLLNAAVGADGHTIERELVSRQSVGQFGELKELADRARAGEIDVLIVAETNPVYAAPPELELEKTLRENVPLVIHCSDRIDETGACASYLASTTHYLEAWGDALPFDGVYSIQQPVIRPLYESRAFEESLLVWFANSGLVPEFKAYMKPSEVPPGNHPGGANFETGPWYRYLRDHWREVVYPKANAVNDFESFWEAVLRQGVWESPEARQEAPRFRMAQTLALLPDGLGEATERQGLKNKELVMYASVKMGAGDGSDPNNGHLQELPDPITRHTWGGCVMVSPKTLRESGLSNGDVVNLRPSGQDRELPFQVIMVPGMHDDVVALPLGYGRSRVGDVGDEIGSNGYAFSTMRSRKVGGRSGLEGDGSGQVHMQVLGGFDVELEPTGESRELAVPQGSQTIDLQRRGVISVATLEQWRHDQTAGIHKHPPLKDFWKDHEYKLKWGMAVDLSRCTGCNACAIACQEENNIPVVGRQGVIEGREMHWIRVDRYYKLPYTKELDEKLSSAFKDPMFTAQPYVTLSEYLEEPRVLFQPMMCQHCENAPCETVCPVLATVHSSDGLNQMAYNRCVGTRYCSNNCPFKVRRFNWYNYGEDRSEEFFARIYPELKRHGRLNATEPMQMGHNPEVTVRSRGVMEKCTFCVQRIRRAKWEAKKENRTQMRDGDVVTACQQTCPADAISFGNLLDPNAEVAQKHAQARALSPLGEIGVESSVAYLTNVVHAEKVDELSEPHGHGGHQAGGEAHAGDEKKEGASSHEEGHGEGDEHH